MPDTSGRTPIRTNQDFDEPDWKQSTGETVRTRIWRLGTPILIAATSVVLLWLLSPELRSNLADIVALTGSLDAASIKQWVLSFDALSPVIYFLIVVGQVIVNPIPAGPVTLAGALIFGVWKGLALSMVGSLVGSVLIFAAVRRWGEPLLLRIVDEETCARYAGRLGQDGWWFLFIMLLPMMPDDAVCALAGLSAMSFGRYVAFMIAGRLPGATLTALLASDVITGSTAGWITAGLIILVLLALGVIYRSRLESWLLRHTRDEHAVTPPDLLSATDEPVPAQVRCAALCTTPLDNERCRQCSDPDRTEATRRVRRR